MIEKKLLVSCGNLFITGINVVIQFGFAAIKKILPFKTLQPFNPLEIKIQIIHERSQ